MVPSVSTLHPASGPAPAALALKLNPEVMHQLRLLQKNNRLAKLVVKDGQFLIKIADKLVFPCSASAETLRFDVYSGNDSNYNFTGTVTNRLNVLNDPKQIKEHLRVAASPPKPTATKPSTSATNTNTKPKPQPQSHEKPVAASLSLKSPLYSVTLTDTKQDVAAKFLALVALGPITPAMVESMLGTKCAVPPAELAELYASHTQPYRANDTFIQDDVFPSVALGACTIDPDTSYVILKDKAYKELRPWNVRAYTDYERRLVLDNASNALGRLGFLETHPLRRQILEKSTFQPQHKKSSSLGGGILSSTMSRKGSPQVLPASPMYSYKKSATESPKMVLDRKEKKPDTSPLKKEKRKYVASLLLSGSSSEDEKGAKRQKAGKRSDSSGSSGSRQSLHSNGTLCTLPSLGNDEHEASEEDRPPKAVLPARSQSAMSSTEKKQQFYTHLAAKFRNKYQEYERLHQALTREPRRSAADTKRQVMHLFELHNLLAQWKRKLWDYHNENHMAEGIMNLLRHRKRVGGPNPVSAPGSSQFLTQDRFHKAHTTSPAVKPTEKFRIRQPPKKALDY